MELYTWEPNIDKKVKKVMINSGDSKDVSKLTDKNLIKLINHFDKINYLLT